MALKNRILYTLRLFFLSFLFFIFFLNSTVLCDVLTLDDCVKIALKNNLEIMEKEKNLNYSKTELKGSKAGYYPKLDFTKSYTSSKFVTYTPTYTFELIPTPPPNPPQYRLIEGEMVRKDIMKENYKMGVSLKQLIFDSGRTESLIESKKGNLNFAYLECQRIKQELIYKVKENYFNILIAKNLLNLAEENLNLYKKHLQMISAREKQGMATYQERLKCEAEISQQELNFLNANNSYQLSLSSLNSILGRDINFPLEVKDCELQDDFNLSYEECLNFAYKNRIELKQIKIQEDISRAFFKGAKAEKYPLISATAAYEYYDEKYPPEEATYNIGILFTFPLYDGGSRDSNIEGTKIQIGLKKVQEEKIKQSIALEVKEVYQSIISAKEKMKATEIYLKQTEENFKMVEKKYNLGMANLIELLDMKNLYIQAQTNYIKEKYNFYISKAKLEKVTGEEL